MNNNLLKFKQRESLIKRVNNLQPDNRGNWGKMNPTEMLMHCNSCNHQILKQGRSSNKTTFKQYFLRILALYLAPNFTRNLRTEHYHDMQGKARNTSFESERTKFIELIRQFGDLKNELTLTHPAFGNISTKQWGIAAYKHMDHHLRQFGV